MKHHILSVKYKPCRIIQQYYRRDYALTEKNVLGTELQACCFDPITGYFRDGYCRTDTSDRGSHVIAAQITDEFLQFTLSRGNDLITPAPPYFPGLKDGDFWCLCALRWKEALHIMEQPPKVKLLACHEKALEYVTLEQLKLHALDLS